MAEKEYIDKGYVLYIVKYYANMQTWSKKNILSEILRKIGKEKAADVVEVVRCRDCRHYGGITFGRTCRMFSGAYTRIEMSEDGFCSYGERKEGAEDDR